MSTVTLKCPACHFTKDVALRSVPKTAKRVTCPKCRHIFQYIPPRPSSIEAEKPRSPDMDFTFTELNTSSGTEAGGDLRKPKNLLIALVFLLVFVALFAGRLYFSNQALNTPAPNFVTASEYGVATQWADRILVTDLAGNLLEQISLPEDIMPTQMIWVGDDLWIADYHSHQILVIDEDGQHWQPLTGSRIKAHFKIVPDISNDRIFVSNGHAIQVYDLYGEFQYSFGKEGRSPGQLKFPNQFQLDDEGNLLIANTKSPAIDKFSPDGTFLSRVVSPTGHPNYRYPTNVILLPERIATLEADGYLQDARIALYDRQGKYLGQSEGINGFKLIGDIAAWEDRIFASDLENGRVYAFSAKDLSFLGDYSADLKRLGDDFQADFRLWTKLSRYSLIALLTMLVPLAIVYYRFRSRGARDRQEPTVGKRVDFETPRASDKKVNPVVAPTKRQPKSTHLKAALLSALFPGLGHFYKRQIIRGALFMISFTPVVLSLAIIAEPAYVGSVDWAPVSIARLVIILGMGLLIYVSGIWDALKS